MNNNLKQQFIEIVQEFCYKQNATGEKIEHPKFKYNLELTPVRLVSPIYSGNTSRLAVFFNLGKGGMEIDTMIKIIDLMKEIDNTFECDLIAKYNEA